MKKVSICLNSALLILSLGSTQTSALAETGRLSDSINPQNFEISQGIGLGSTGTGKPSGGTIGGGTRLHLPDTNSGSPDSTAGGGTRGTCITLSSSRLFRALLPNPANQDSIVGKTVSDQGTLWFYVPDSEAVSLEFTLFDQTSPEPIYSETIDNKLQGFVSVTLPSDLESDTEYIWDLNLICNETDRSADKYIYGSVISSDIDSIQLVNSPAVISSLEQALLSETSYLSLTDKTALGAALAASKDAGTMAMVNKRLKEHYIELWDRYSSQESYAGKSLDGMELAQLSTFFDLWVDAVDLFAENRVDYPGDWRALLDNLFADNVTPHQAVSEELQKLFDSE